MKYDELIKKILNSKKEDWIPFDELGIWVFKDDLLISIQDESPAPREYFYEEWATKHPDQNAYQMRFFIKYANNPIADIYAADVDGGRAIIPYPDLETKCIDKFHNKIGEIVNSDITRYHEYIERSGLTYQM